MDPDAVELRVIGCLMEKQRTTPDQYPLTLNALRLACNQATNRDPVVDYDEETIRGAIARLRRREWVRFASGQGSRAAKYRHLVDQALQLDSAEQAILTVMLLRGPQTPGELKGRTERMHLFGSLAEVDETISRLIERGYAERVARRPGQKEDRFGHLLGENQGTVPTVSGENEGTVPTVSGENEGTVPTVSGENEGTVPTVSLEERVAKLEREVAELRARYAASDNA
jgi:uncharacterized protein YceH (UPF0502 family)